MSAYWGGVMPATEPYSWKKNCEVN